MPWAALGTHSLQEGLYLSLADPQGRVAVRLCFLHKAMSAGRESRRARKLEFDDSQDSSRQSQSVEGFQKVVVLGTQIASLVLEKQEKQEKQGRRTEVQLWVCGVARRARTACCRQCWLASCSLWRVSPLLRLGPG